MRIRLECSLAVKEIADALGGSAENIKTEEITHIVTDSRKARHGDLFFPLKGERFDGEDFVPDAISRGALAVSRRHGNNIITASTAEDALLLTAKLYKRKLSSLRATVAITGSVGKTTTKEFTKIILSQKYRVHATRGNENNAVGVPYTLLSAPKYCEVLVCELGMNHIGEISALSKCIEPNIGVITNIGTAHIGNLGNREQIAKAKLEILDGMKDGTVIVPSEEALTQGFKGRKSLSLGTENANAKVIIKEETDAGILFDYKSDIENINGLFLKIPGQHILSCLSFGIYASQLLGASSNDISSAISNINGDILRQKYINVLDFRIYDDTYNSSPEAVKACISSIRRTSGGRFSVLLGDMLELGEKSRTIHFEIGKFIGASGAIRLYTLGEFGDEIAAGAMHSGMSREQIFVNGSNAHEAAASSIIDNHECGETILFKGSHAMRLSRVIELIKRYSGG